MQIRDWWWLICHGERKYFDLKKVLSEPSRRKRVIHVYYAARHRIDRLHANRIESIGGVLTHPYPSGEHALIKQLRSSGELGQIMERAIQLADSAGRS
jgi:hypothetical protein